MNKPFLKTTLAFAVFTAMTVSVQAQDQVTEEKEGIVQADATKLQTIVVTTAGGFEQNIADAPASISVITAEELQKKSYTDVIDAVKNMPGVSVQGGGNNKEITIRGMGAAYTKYLVDGRPVSAGRAVNGNGTDGGKIGAYLPTINMIERVEVVRGPMSSLYGSDAMGGVINIITKKIPSEWGGSLTLNHTMPTTSSDLGRTIQSGLVGYGPLTDTLGMRATVGITEQEADQGYQTSDRNLPGMAGSKATGQSGSRDQNANLKFDYTPNDIHSLSLELGYSLQENNASTTPQVVDGKEQALLAWGPSELEHRSVSLSHDAQWGFGDSKITAYYNDYDQSQVTETGPTTQKSKESIVEANLNIPFKLGVEHVATVGGQWKSEELVNTRNIGLAIPSYDGKEYGSELEGDTWALFVEDKIVFNDQVNLTLGNRFDHHDKFGTHNSPRAYLVVQPNDALTIKGGVAQGFRAPSLKENTAGAATRSGGNGCTSLKPLGYVSGGCYMAGNADLQPEESTNYELGFNFAQNDFDLGLTYFHTDFKNKIEYRALGEINGVWWTQYQNAEKARVRGLEASVALPLLENLSWKTNATYYFESKNLVTGRNLSTIPELSVYSALNWTPTDPLSLELAAQYTGEQYTASIEDTVVMQKPHTVFNLSANYEVNDQVTVRGGLNNLFDKKLVNASNDYYLDRQEVFVGLTYNF
ncbi:TonB-dependent receptor domain-containing protein [Acinetobacter sp. YH12105]|uniref:TonB-dependent receptor domain-containing protein n=1 Tax=Acinetobacter sp. YH12105 TaxID=2601093 RepID=UPI0015D1EF5D|nr:TonB-dependent receptor [Acinetobacter sp. YH12105]